MIKLSVIIIACNEEKMIGDCLKSVRNLANEIILVDSGSTDRTVQLAKKAGAKVIYVTSVKLEFAHWRNLGLKAAKGKWILYLDADERITSELEKEVKEVTRDTKYVAFEIPRRNFYFGKEMHYGGAWPDYVKRLFLKEKLKCWERELHEDPVFDGKLGTLKQPMIHLTHRDLTSMVAKTSQWSKIEAKLLFESGHPTVTWWRILRVMLTEFWQKAIKLQGWRDGTAGWIEIVFQMFSRFVTYAKLWEMQNQEKLKVKS